MFLLVSAGLLAGCGTNTGVNVTGTGTLQTSVAAVNDSGGTFVNASGGVVYSRDISDDIQNGYGISYYDNGNIQYKGYWKNGKAEGTGTLYYMNGLAAYVGQWDN